MVSSAEKKAGGHGGLPYLHLTPEQRHEILEEFFFEGEERPAYAFQFYCLSSLSAVIAAAGLILPSTAVVIGAMLVSPLMTPILGIAAAMVMGWPQRAIRVIGRLTLGTILVFAIGYLIPLAFRYPSTMRLTDEILARTNPELPDLIVALSAGVAAAYMTLRREALAALPGVAIAVALVPPLCVSGILTYLSEFTLAWEAFQLYVTNLAAIVLSAAAVFLAMGFTPKRHNRRWQLRVGLGMATALILVLSVTVPLALRTIADISDLRDRAIAIDVVTEWLGDAPVEIVDVDVEADLIQIEVLVTLPAGSRSLSDLGLSRYLGPHRTIDTLQQRMVAALHKQVEITVVGSFGFWRSTCPASRTCYP